MSIYKCKMCGGELNITEKTSVCECEYCGSKQTIPTVDDEKLVKLYDRANRLRMANDFDKAFAIYENIIQESDKEAEAYWGLLLCKYGIEYVDDPATGNKIPTCHRVSFDSIMEDNDFEMVMENADIISRNLYREQAKQIEEIRKGIIEVSGKEAPYDIFICYKETAEDGERTIDSVMAQNIYDQLTAKGYRVFFSRITLEDKLGTEYEPYIFAALNSAKVMLAFGTSYDYYNAVWVKNEWSRYIKLMAKDKEKHLIPCYKDIDAYDMPKEFKHLQAQDMGKVGAEQDLLRGIDKILRPEVKTQASNSYSFNQEELQKVIASALASNMNSNVNASLNSNVNALLERGFVSLEDGDFEKAKELFEEVVTQHPKCAEAYMGKLMSYRNCKNIDDFATRIFDYCRNETENHVKLDYTIKELIENKYIISNEISENFFDVLQKLFDNLTTYTLTTDMYRLSKTNDYLSDYCHHTHVLGLQPGEYSKFYEMYIRYANDDVLNRFNINKTVFDIYSREKETERKREQDLKEKYSSSNNIIKIIEAANVKAKSIIDDAESEYQAELQKWQKECDEITREWPQKRHQIQLNWENECNEKRIKYEQDKKNIDENNEKVKQLYQQAMNQYEDEILKIDKQISDLNSQFDGLVFFAMKQKKSIKANIKILKENKESKRKPIISDYGKIMDEPRLILPNQPVNNETPNLPLKPIRKDIKQNVNAEFILAREFTKEGIEIKRIIELGEYKGKAISWIVLEETDDKALLLSEYALDRIPYYDIINYYDICNNKEKCEEIAEKINWETCTLRPWLNNNFLNEALGKEKDRILLTSVETEVDSKTPEKGSSYTNDKIFLLSENEVSKYKTCLSLEGKFSCYPTDYVKSNDPNSFEYSDTSSWWLRSAAHVEIDRNVKTYSILSKVAFESIFSDRSTRFGNGVRPALWIKLKN